MSAVRLVPSRGNGPDDNGPDENGAGDNRPERRAPDFPHDDEEEDEGSRSITNLIFAVAVVAVIAIGIWLVDALLEQRRIDNCAAQGRRNCAGVEVPAR